MVSLLFVLLAVSAAVCLQHIHSHRSVLSLSEFMAERINDLRLWPCLLVSLCVCVRVCFPLSLLSIFRASFHPDDIHLALFGLGFDGGKMWAAPPTFHHLSH